MDELATKVKAKVGVLISQAPRYGAEPGVCYVNSI